MDDSPKEIPSQYYDCQEDLNRLFKLKREMVSRGQTIKDLKQQKPANYKHLVSVKDNVL